jgi:hypothetical protein
MLARATPFARTPYAIVLSALLLTACGQPSTPSFEQFESRVTAALTDKATGARNTYSAMVKAYINNNDKSVNFVLSDPIPKWTLQCDECTAALFAEAKRVTEAAYPHLAPLTLK